MSMPRRHRPDCTKPQAMQNQHIQNRSATQIRGNLHARLAALVIAKMTLSCYLYTCRYRGSVRTVLQIIPAKKFLSSLRVFSIVDKPPAGYAVNHFTTQSHSYQRSILLEEGINTDNVPKYLAPDPASMSIDYKDPALSV